MTESERFTDRRSLLERAGLIVAGGVLATGAGAAADCYRTQFWATSREDSPGGCAGTQGTMVPAGTYGRVSVYCGDNDQWAYFECQDDPGLTGWIDRQALAPCPP